MKSQLFWIGMLCLAVIFAMMVVSARKNGSPVSTEDGSTILITLCEMLDSRDNVLRIDRDLVFVSREIPDSWWNDIAKWRRGHRPITARELHQFAANNTERQPILEIAMLAPEKEGHPRFAVWENEYFWTEEGGLFVRERPRPDLYAAVEIDGIWQVFYIVPTSVE